MTASVTQQLAEWIVEARYEDIPPAQRNRVIELCGRLEDIANLRELAEAVTGQVRGRVKYGI